VSFWVSLSISHFLFLLHGYAINRGVVLVYSRRYPNYSRLTLPWIPLIISIPLLTLSADVIHKFKCTNEDYTGAAGGGAVAGGGTVAGEGMAHDE
jgi:hypothetical protein